MTKTRLAELVAKARKFGMEGKKVDYQGRQSTFRLGCLVEEPNLYDPNSIEQSLDVTLPSELVELWELTSHLKLFVDVDSSMWGLELYAPPAVIDVHRIRKEYREWDYREHDLILGEFIGDADTLVLRCNPSLPDFGSVLIGWEIDNRDDWKTVADNLVEFLEKYINSNGQKFWEIIS